MEYTSIITTTIVAAFLAFFYSYLSRGNKIELKSDVDGKKKLRVHKLIYFVSIGLIIFAIGMMLTPLFLLGEQDFLILLVVFAAMGGFVGIIGIYFLLEYRNSRVSYDKNGLLMINYKNGKSTLIWPDLVDVKLNAFTNKIILKTKHGKIEFSQFMKGVNVLLEDVEAYSGIETGEVLKKVNAFSPRSTKS